MLRAKRHEYIVYNDSISEIFRSKPDQIYIDTK